MLNRNPNRNWYPLFFLLLFLFPPYHTVYAQQEEPTTDTSTGEELTPDLTQQQQQGLAGQKHQQPAVILTFDDNYRGQYEHAKPIMERYGANGTFFVSCMAGFTMTWDQVRDLYNSGFDKEKYDSVGLYIKALNIKQAIAHGKKTYNFLQGNERYKYELGAHDFFVYTIEMKL